MKKYPRLAVVTLLVLVLLSIAAAIIFGMIRFLGRSSLPYYRQLTEITDRSLVIYLPDTSPFDMDWTDQQGSGSRHPVKLTLGTPTRFGTYLVADKLISDGLTIGYGFHVWFVDKNQPIPYFSFSSPIITEKSYWYLDEDTKGDHYLLASNLALKACQEVAGANFIVDCSDLQIQKKWLNHTTSFDISPNVATSILDTYKLRTSNLSRSFDLTVKNQTFRGFGYLVLTPLTTQEYLALNQDQPLALIYVDYNEDRPGDPNRIFSYWNVTPWHNYEYDVYGSQVYYQANTNVLPPILPSGTDHRQFWLLTGYADPRITLETLHELAHQACLYHKSAGFISPCR